MDFHRLAMNLKHVTLQILNINCTSNVARCPEISENIEINNNKLLYVEITGFIKTIN